MSLKPGLYITSTPIGNLKDITLRALETLQSVDAIICEDTRVTSKLLSHYNIKKKLLVYNDHADEETRNKIIAELLDNKAIALVSDAGTPLISDPGFKLIKAAKQHDIYVTIIPGVSSVTAALPLTALPSDNFYFAGFLPQKHQQKINFLKEIKHINSTLIFFDRGSRLADSLTAIQEALGERESSVARELTKVYEEARTAQISDLIEYYSANAPKGEIVILVDNRSGEKASIPDNLDKILKQLLQDNSLRDATKLVSDMYGMPKNEAYKRLLEVKDS